MNGKRVLMGDFNAVRHPEERYNTEFSHGCAEAFNTFIEDNGLLEYQMGGRKYTRVSGSGDKLSKIDRFLVCQMFWDKWPEASVTALPRCESDHNPIMPDTGVSNFGHIPFRFNNSWIGRAGFESTVVSAASVENGSGPPVIVLARKLKKHKKCTKNMAKGGKG